MQRDNGKSMDNDIVNGTLYCSLMLCAVLSQMPPTSYFIESNELARECGKVMLLSRVEGKWKGEGALEITLLRKNGLADAAGCY